MDTQYTQLKQDHPEMFVNDPGGIEITEDGDGGVAYSDRFITLVADPVRFPDGRTGTYNRIFPTQMTQGTAVLPVLPDGTIVMVDHFRHATRSWHWEIPRGFGTIGLSGKDNAAQELSEEIGARVDQIHFLGEVYPDTGLLASSVLLYLARIDRIGSLDDHEGIRRAEALPLAAIHQLVRAGLLRDGFTLAALYRAQLSGLLD
jgi:ADP-ribose pyrophosphatase